MGLNKIALRADIDAVKIKEESHISYKSLNEDLSHVLGHDGHAAILVATAELLNN